MGTRRSPLSSSPSLSASLHLSLLTLQQSIGMQLIPRWLQTSVCRCEMRWVGDTFWQSRRRAARERLLGSACPSPMRDESRGKWLWHVACLVGSSVTVCYREAEHTHTNTQKRSEQPVTVAVEAFSTSLQAGLPWGCEKTHHAKRKKKENTLLRGGCSSLWRLTGASLPWPEHLIRSLCACSIRPATSQCMTHSLRLGDTVTHHLPPASHQLSFRKEFSGVINLALCHPSLSKHTWCFF